MSNVSTPSDARKAVLNMSEMRKAIELNVAVGQTMMFEGASGVGKTENVHQFVDDQPEDFGLFEINLALASLPDLIGLQHFVTRQWQDDLGNSTSYEAAAFAYPYFMFDKRKGFKGRPAFACRHGLILFEEYGQGQGDVKRATAQIMQFGQAGEHSFPSGFVCVALSNRAEDRSGVTKDFDFLINRRNQMQVKAELESWLVWAHAHGVTNMSMAFAARNEQHVFSNKAPEKQGPWLTPRSLAGVDRVIHEGMRQGYKLDDPFLRINIAGMIGEGHAHTYIAFAKIKDQLPSFQSIVNDPKNAVMPASPDQQMFLAFDLAHKVKRETMKAVTTYMQRMPKDFSIAFYRSAMHRDPTLRSTKEFGDWAVENLQLNTAILAA